MNSLQNPENVEMLLQQTLHAVADTLTEDDFAATHTSATRDRHRGGGSQSASAPSSFPLRWPQAQRPRSSMKDRSTWTRSLHRMS